MFYGHFVLVIPRGDVYTIRSYVYAGISTAHEIFSYSNGSFILRFFEPVPIYSDEAPPDPEELQQRWLSHRISNFEYLLAINHLAQRSFIDLAAYPVFPRVTMDYESVTFGESVTFPVRDLSSPIDIVADQSPAHELMSKRFVSQHFHHSENPSNPMTVSIFLLRTYPFCRYQWDVSQGWDAGNRHFLSVEFNLSVSAKSVCEFPPELFSFPEALLNLNHFVLPKLDSFDVELPKWSPDVFRFVEFHREFLESEPVRERLHRWIDLLFGVARCGKLGEDALNIYHEMSYYQGREIQNQHSWMLLCGQVPAQVFAESHPPFTTPRRIGMDDLLVVSAGQYPVEPRFFVRESDCSVVVGPLVWRDPRVPFIAHRRISADGQFIACTTVVSTVFVLRVSKEAIAEHAMMELDYPRFSELFEEQMLCYTACRENVVIWSYANSQIVNVIDMPAVSCIVVNPERRCVFLSSGFELFQYSVNGFRIRSITFDQKVSAFAAFGVTFWMHRTALVVGTVKGTVILVGADPSGELNEWRRTVHSKSKIRMLKIDEDAGYIIVG
jgi:hypothetical protein